jgi:protoheme IX farnesyltransferase
LTYAVYVLIYTPLKRRTVWSTVIGALPGALPPVMGWTAVRGELDAPAGALFAILFCWQLPHFLAIDWMFRDDYRAGGFRTLATTDTSGARSGRWMIVSTIALAIASVLPVAIGNAGLLYLVVAIVLAGVFLYRAFGFAASPQQETARSAMLYSVLYLPVLLAALVVDSLL